MIFAQVPCQEIFFQSPYNNTLSNRNEFSMEPERATTILNNNPDVTNYKDLFPNKNYVYNLIFRVIRNDDGSRTTGEIGEAEIMNAVRDLNLNFNQFRIFFKYRGFEYIDNSNLAGDQNPNDFGSNFIKPYSSPNEFCLFILDGNIVSNDSDGNLVSSPGLGYLLGNVTFLSTFGLTSARILTHELGHNFYLYHDFRNYGATSGCEHVTRDYSPNNLYYNASGSGDQIWDTPATKIWDFSEYDSNGFYVGQDIDCSSNPDLDDRYYQNESHRFDNFMHYHEGNDLSSYQFSPGQGLRIRWALSTDAQEGYGIWSQAETTIEELYQPFETLNTQGNTVISVTNNGNGTANVCRNWVRNDRFQKGFDCIYYTMNDIVLDTSVPDDLKVITERTSDCKVEITQVAPGVKEIVTVLCNKGKICTDEPYIKGTLYSTKVLGSMNITIQELTLIEAQDPDLYSKLMEDYYYILKKETTSGAEYNATFYKQ